MAISVASPRQSYRIYFHITHASFDHDHVSRKTIRVCWMDSGNFVRIDHFGASLWVNCFTVYFRVWVTSCGVLVCGRFGLFFLVRVWKVFKVESTTLVVWSGFLARDMFDNAIIFFVRCNAVRWLCEWRKVMLRNIGRWCICPFFLSLFLISFFLTT